MVASSSGTGSKNKQPGVPMYFQSIVVKEKHGLRQEKLLIDHEAVVRWESRTTLYIGAKSQYRVSSSSAARKNKADAEDTTNDHVPSITVSMTNEDGDMVLETPTHLYELYEPILDETPGDEKRWLHFQHCVLAMDPNNNNDNDKQNKRDSSTGGKRSIMSSGGGPRSGCKTMTMQQQKNSNSNSSNHPIHRGRAYGRRQRSGSSFPSPYTASSAAGGGGGGRMKPSILPLDEDEHDGFFDKNKSSSSMKKKHPNVHHDTHHDDEPPEPYDDDDHIMQQQQQNDDDVQEEKAYSSIPLGKKRASPVFSDDDEDGASDTKKLPPRFQQKNARAGAGNKSKRLRKTSVLYDDDDNDELFDADDERATRPSPPDPASPSPTSTETAAATGAPAAAAITKNNYSAKTTKQGTLLNFFRIKNPKPITITSTTTTTPRLSISDGQDHHHHKSGGGAATPGIRSTTSAASSGGSCYNPSSSSCASPPRRRNNAATTTASTPPPRTTDRRDGSIPVTARKSSLQRKKRSNISSATWLSQDQEDNCHDHFNNDEDDDDENDPFKLKKKRPTNHESEEEVDALQEFPSSPPQAYGTTTSTKQPLDLLDSVPQLLKYQRSNLASFDPRGGGMMRARLHPRGGKDYGSAVSAIVGSIRRRPAPTRRSSILSRHHSAYSSPMLPSSDNCWDPSKTPVFSRTNYRSNYSTTRTGLFSENNNDSPTASTTLVVPNPCRGLQNLGNTCYMNASLQMLYTLKDFCGSLASLWKAAEQMEAAAATTTSTATTGVVSANSSSSASTTLPLTKSVQCVYNMLQVSTTRKKKPVHPGAVKDAMDDLTDKFVGYEQRDAHEFLSDLIDFLHEEHLKAKKALFAALSPPEAPPAPQDSVHDDLSDPIGANDSNDNGSPDGANGNKENDIERGNEQQPGVVDKTTASSSLAENAEEKNDAATASMTADAPKEATLQDTVVLSSSSSTTACPDDDDDFRLTCEVGLKCLSCGYFRKKEEIYRHLSLDIIAPVTHGHAETNTAEISKSSSSKKAPTTITPCSLAASLEHFFQPEVREINCEKCANGTHASQSLRIVKRPKALLLHLKRFIVVEKPQPAVDDNTSEKAGGGDENAHPNSPSSRRSRPVEYEFQKNKAPVEIAERLSLANFLSTSEESTEESSKSAGEYKIQSIVHHIGSRASSGHYTADALRRSKDLPVEHANNDEKDADDKKEEGNNNKDGDQHDKSSTPNPRNDDASLDSGAARSKAIADKKGNSEEQSLSAASGPGQEQEEWISFDDTNSGRNTFANIAGSNFKQRTAYMLLYKFSPSAAAASTGKTPTAPLQESCKVADDSAPPAEPAPMEL